MANDVDLRGHALERMLRHADLKIVDIGARAKPRPEIRTLSRFTHLFACEPDAEEAARLSVALRGVAEWNDVTVIREALAAGDGEAVLHLTRKPGYSSLLRPNDPVVSRQTNREAFEVVATVRVPTLRLDTAADRYGFRDACFVKLDTQGTELEILKSGENLLRRSVLGVYVETEFQPFYLDQALFADVDTYLRGHGFTLMDMNRALRRPRGHSPAIFSRRQLVWAHCLYLRDPLLIETAPRSERELERYIALALAYKHFDLALTLVRDGAAARALQREWGPQLHDDVVNVAKNATKRILKRVGPEQHDAVLATSFRDAKGL